LDVGKRPYAARRLEGGGAMFAEAAFAGAATTDAECGCEPIGIVPEIAGGPAGVATGGAGAGGATATAAARIPGGGAVGALLTAGGPLC
jgi:hypothetical protein